MAGSEAGRLAAVVGIAAGLLCMACGYAWHRTTLVVQADHTPDEPSPDDVTLPPDDEWDDDASTPSPDDVTLPADDEWDDDPAEPLEPEPAPAEPEPATPPPTRVAGEWDLVKGAVQGIVERLADGRLALTWIGKPGDTPPACPT